MPGVVDINNMMFKAKIKAKRHKHVELEVEIEGSLAFLTSFYKTFTDSWEKNAYIN